MTSARCYVINKNHHMTSENIAIACFLHTMKNAIDNAKNIINGIHFIKQNQLVIKQPHSHSIVAGGLLDTSYVTRLIPRTSLMMREDTFFNNA